MRKALFCAVLGVMAAASCVQIANLDDFKDRPGPGGSSGVGGTQAIGGSGGEACASELGPGGDQLGLFDPASLELHLLQANGTINTFSIASDPDAALYTTTMRPFVADLDGDGSEEVGVYDSGTATFYLRSANAADVPVSARVFGGAGAAHYPLGGNWQIEEPAPHANGQSTIGVYFGEQGTFFLRLDNMTGPDPEGFGYGLPMLMPVMGDWDGVNGETVGVYRQDIGVFFLKEANEAGVGRHEIAFEVEPSTTWTPIAGKWGENQADSVGMFDPATRTFYLRETVEPASQIRCVRFGPTSGTFVPVVGRW